MKPKMAAAPPPPPIQPELKNKGVMEDAESAPDAAVSKRRANRDGLRAAYLTAPTQSVGVNLG